MNVILSGIVGSIAYGLAHAGSDIDRLGVYAEDTLALAGLNRPRETYTTTNPDTTMHEVGKWARLAMVCNPTVIELAFLPANLYDVRTPLGDDLISIRRAFLCAPKVRSSYLGYATQQFKRIENRGDGSFSADTRKRTAKHARHLARLLFQGTALYTTGDLPIWLDDAEYFIRFGDRVADGELDDAKKLLSSAEDIFNHTPRPALPDRPDVDTIEDWIRSVRVAHFKP